MTREQRLAVFTEKFERLLKETFPDEEDLQYAVFAYQEIVDPHLITNACIACIRDVCLAFGMSQIGEVHESDKINTPIQLPSQRMH